MSKEILCLFCGNKGQVIADDKNAFENRGRFKGKTVYKCKKCGAGLFLGLFSGVFLGKPKVIPPALLETMEGVGKIGDVNLSRNIMINDIVSPIILNVVVHIISLGILSKGLDKYNVIIPVQYNDYILWIFILWVVFLFPAWIYYCFNEWIYGRFEKYKFSSLLIPLVINILIIAIISYYIFLKLPNLKYTTLPIIWAFFILPSWLLFRYYQNKEWIVCQKKSKM